MDSSSNTDTGNEPVRIFVSYAREDKDWLNPEYPHNLIPFLQESLRKLNVIFWHDTGLIPGDVFKRKIEEEIDRAQIALLLVSQAFLNSEFIETVEMPRIANRTRLGQMVMVPVLVERCEWREYSVLADRQMVPVDKPLINYTESKPEWAEVRAEILAGLKAQVKRIREQQERTQELIRDARTKIEKKLQEWEMQQK